MPEHTEPTPPATPQERLIENFPIWKASSTLCAFAGPIKIPAMTGRACGASEHGTMTQNRCSSSAVPRCWTIAHRFEATLSTYALRNQLLFRCNTVWGLRAQERNRLRETLQNLS
jgi:hypothetical protein